MTTLPFNEAEEARFTAVETTADAAVPATGGTITGDVTLSSASVLVSNGEGIQDSNGNEVVVVGGGTASAVNHLSVTNAATGNNVGLSVAGDDTNVGLAITPKATGNVTVTVAGGDVILSDGTCTITLDGGANSITLDDGNITIVLDGSHLKITGLPTTDPMQADAFYLNSDVLTVSSA